jgi:hypothetical protein
VHGCGARCVAALTGLVILHLVALYDLALFVHHELRAIRALEDVLVSARTFLAGVM